MVCRIAELQYKEVIDISDGTRYGFVEDVELDPERGAIESIVVGGRPRWFGLLGREPDQVFPWPSIKRFGEDIILVEGKAVRGRDVGRR
ncbi:MAG: YlmC/YmxH family sporulation protein [Oscillospiraceae bacterium]|nr:YlmC/YmxH family sporulation protein [Oscillospiraceae bacterium]